VKRQRRRPLLTRWYLPRIRRAERNGKMKRALRLAHFWTHFWPGDSNAWYFRISLLIESGEFAAAEPVIREAMWRHPAETLYQTQLVENLLWRERVDDAREAVRDLAAAHPTSPLAACCLGYIAWQERDRDEYQRRALHALEAVEASDPPWHGEIVQRIALMLLRMDMQERAIEFLRKAAEGNDYDAGPLLLLGVLIEAKDTEYADRLLQEARSLIRNDTFFERHASILREAYGHAPEDRASVNT
jgi:Flp pilus assembly protein TadD